MRYPSSIKVLKSNSMTKKILLVPDEIVISKIFLIRGKKDNP